MTASSSGLGMFLVLLATRLRWRGFECRDMPTLLESLPLRDCRVCKGNVCYTNSLVEKMDLPLYLHRRPVHALAVNQFPAVPEKEV